MKSSIELRNVRTHNLKGFSLDIPKEKLVVVTGVSGSGKSSLVFDTLYTEAQRQLIETFSTFARRRLPKLSRPNVDEIRNLGTGIIIDQKRLGRTLRSTVGTATELHTYLRLLFSRCAKPCIGPSFYFSFNNPEGMCEACKGLGKRIRIDAEKLTNPSKNLLEGGIVHPDYKVGGYYWREFTSNGLFDPEKKLGSFSKEEMDLLLYADNVTVHKTHAGYEYNKKWDGLIKRLENFYINKGEDELPESRKDAYQRYLVYCDCDVCDGKRINARALTPQLDNRNIFELCEIELIELDNFLGTINDEIAIPIVSKMRRILKHLIQIGVGYLNLNRAVATLSGGESQRVKMARQLDCDLTGLMIVLDEPSIGLHPRDTEHLIDMLYSLRDKGNTVIVVEHDPSVIACADHIIEIGPQAGRTGGHLCFEGTYADLKKSDCPSGIFISKQDFSTKQKYRCATDWIEIKNATAHNLKNVNAAVPMGILCCITGVAGSGKSTLVHEELIKKVQEAIIIDQNPVNRSSRSNALTYTEIFDLVRKGFSQTTGMKPSMFSFNSEGACPECKGQGDIKLEMSFMDDITIQCSRCEGKRYIPEVLDKMWNGKNIDDVLRMTVDEGLNFFQNKQINAQLAMLHNVGLGYIELGQSLSPLSGGEAQRLKLAGELGKKGNLYIMDEPTTGLHMSDISRLLELINNLVDNGNSVIVIEHNLDVIRTADWIIDMGPEGGQKGGHVIACGTPVQVASNPGSVTGKYLKPLLCE